MPAMISLAYILTLAFQHRHIHTLCSEEVHVASSVLVHVHMQCQLLTRQGVCVLAGSADAGVPAEDVGVWRGAV